MSFSQDKLNVKFEVVSRGSIRIYLGNKMLVAEGELTFHPPVFYVDSASMKFWEAPVKEALTMDERELILQGAREEKTDGTKILFD
jgi:hypothetical protein